MAADGIGKDRITIGPANLAGKPTIRGLRVSVKQVLLARAAGISHEELLEDYPDLQSEDLQACLGYAALNLQRFPPGWPTDNGDSHPAQTH
jgi:uncharacterized protein (DUF433 family)